MCVCVCVYVKERERERRKDMCRLVYDAVLSSLGFGLFFQSVAVAVPPPLLPLCRGESQVMRLVEQYQQSAADDNRPQLKEEQLDKVRRIRRLADVLESNLLNLDVLLLKLAYL